VCHKRRMSYLRRATVLEMKEGPSTSVETPVIALTLPRDNLAGIAAGTYSPQVGNGYHLAPAPSISEAKPRLVFLPALLSRSPI